VCVLIIPAEAPSPDKFSLDARGRCKAKSLRRLVGKVESAGRITSPARDTRSSPMKARSPLRSACVSSSVVWGSSSPRHVKKVWHHVQGLSAAARTPGCLASDHTSSPQERSDAVVDGPRYTKSSEGSRDAARGDRLKNALTSWPRAQVFNGRQARSRAWSIASHAPGGDRLNRRKSQDSNGNYEVRIVPRAEKPAGKLRPRPAPKRKIDSPRALNSRQSSAIGDAVSQGPATRRACADIRGRLRSAGQHGLRRRRGALDECQIGFFADEIVSKAQRPTFNLANSLATKAPRGVGRTDCRPPEDAGSIEANTAPF